MLQMIKRIVSGGVSVVIAAAAIGGLAVSPAVAAATPNITTVQELSGAYPQDIAEGANGDMWITQPAANEIGRITPGGKLKEFRAFPAKNTGYYGPHDIILGPDNDLWYLASGDNSVGYINDALEQITPSGHVTQFPLGNIGITGEGAVTLAVAHNEFWLANGENFFVFSASGTYVASYGPDPTGTGSELIPAETTGPDGNIWYWATNVPGGAGTVSSTGVFNRYPDGNGTGDGPKGVDHTITTGPDGNVWMTDFNADEIISTTSAGSVTPHTVTSGVGAITGAADGNLYFVEDAQPAGEETVLGIGRITTGGVVTNIPTPQNGTDSTGPYSDITSGPDGTVWFVGQGNVYRFHVATKKS